MVHESDGPVGGLVSQNCVCSIWPPGALKQHRLSTIVVLWQLMGESLGQVGASLTKPRVPMAIWEPAAAPMNSDLTEGSDADMLGARFDQNPASSSATFCTACPAMFRLR